MKKNKFWTIAKVVGKFVLGLIIKNQKGIKNTPNTDIVDEVLDKI